MTTKITPAEFVRRERKKKGEEQKTVATRGPYPESTISRIEGGKIKITANNLDKIVKQYGFILEQRRELEKLIAANQAVEELDEVGIICQLMRLPREVRHRIVRTVIAYDYTDQVGDAAGMD